MTTADADADLVLVLDQFITHALARDTGSAVGIALGMLDRGVPADSIIEGLLAPAQHQIGERWQRNDLTIADEHLATGIIDSAVHALAGTVAVPGTTGLVVVACAEGDWHGMAARMFSEQLRCHGVVTAFLGASTPSDHIAAFIARHNPEALAISCSIPFAFGGVTRLSNVAHSHGVPVLAGGRALKNAPARAHALGADAWGNNVFDALAQLDDWRANPPQMHTEASTLPEDAVELDARADELAAIAFDQLTQHFPPMASYDTRQIARTCEDLAFILRFVAAAVLVDDRIVLTDFLDWLGVVLTARGVPSTALVAGLEALQPIIEQISPAGAALGHLGQEHLAQVLNGGNPTQ